MSRHFIPKQSREHRVACFALYRALLEQCPRLQPLVNTLPGQPNQLEHLIRKQFRRNYHEDSHRLVVVALQKGYEAEELLRTAGDGDNSAQEKVIDILTKVEEEREKGRKASAQFPQPPPKEKIRVSPYPGNTSRIFDRPLPKEKLSGRRHVPVLSAANGMPFLRIKKPQPEFLSRIFRNKIEQRQGWINSISKIEDEFTWAASEDKWDSIVSETHHQSEDNRRWTADMKSSQFDIESAVRRDSQQKMVRARRLTKIVDEERKLRAKERYEQRHSGGGQHQGRPIDEIIERDVNRQGLQSKADRHRIPGLKQETSWRAEKETSPRQLRIIRGIPKKKGSS